MLKNYLCQKKLKLIKYLLLLFFISSSLFGQKTAIKGNVFDKRTKKPLVGAYVYFINNSSGVYTKDKGFFNINLETNKDSVLVYKEGYNQYKTILDDASNYKFYLDEKLETLDAVLINSLSQKNSSKVELGDVVFYAKDLDNMPFIFGEVDVMKLIQYTPGVQQAKEGQSGILVRGGNGSMNLTLIDDIYLHNMSHIGGLISGINSDFIQKMTFSKAGFDASYGGRLSSVTAMETTTGIESFQLDGNIGLLTSKATLKTPIKAINTTVILSGRRTYFDLLKPLFGKSESNSILSPENNYFFYDFLAKTTTDFGKKDQVSLLYYATEDSYIDKGEFDYRNSNWSNLLYGANWLHFFSDSFRSKTILSKSNYKFHFYSNIYPYDYKLNSSIDIISLKEQFFLNKRNHFMKFGFEYNNTNNLPRKLDLSILDSPIVIDNQISYKTHDFSAYFDDKIEVNTNLMLKAGLRLTAFFNETEPKEIRKKYIVLEPRLSLNYKLSDIQSFKFSYQRLYQFLHQASVSSLSLPVDFYLPSNAQVKPQLSNQVSVGYFLDKENFNLAVSPYYNYISNYIEFKNGSINNLFNNNIYDDIVFGNLQSYGLEVSLQAQQGKLSGAFSYTLSSTKAKFNEINNGKPFNTVFDRPHNLNMSVNYQFNSKVKFGALFVLTSGQNHTPPKDIRIVGEEAIINFADKNSSRYPTYHRLDLSCTYTVTERKKWTSKLNFSIYNAYFNKNPFFINYKIQGGLNDNTISIEKETQTLFPILPSITWIFNINK